MRILLVSQAGLAKVECDDVRYIGANPHDGFGDGVRRMGSDESMLRAKPFVTGLAMSAWLVNRG